MSVISSVMNFSDLILSWAVIFVSSFWILLVVCNFKSPGFGVAAVKLFYLVFRGFVDSGTPILFSLVFSRFACFFFLFTVARIRFWACLRRIMNLLLLVPLLFLLRFLCLS